MDIEAAARMTLDLAREHARKGPLREIPGLSLDHVEDMMARWPADGSPTKRCRWLGWMQASVVAMTEGRATLEDMKEINRICAADPDASVDDTAQDPLEDLAPES